MQPRLLLRCDGDDLHLQLDPLPAGARDLWLGTRDGALALQVALAPDASGGATAQVPLAGLLGAGVLRLDVRLRGDGEWPLVPSPPAPGPRHFFRERIGGHGLSAYLSDSAASLVLMTAPLAQHARLAEAEDSRAAFARDLRSLPLEPDLVLFESFLGKQYAGNPRYIYEALRQLRPDLRCVWAYDGPQAIPGDPPRVRRGSPEYLRVLAQAGYRVNNVVFAAHGRKPETVYLQTWHGTPLKRLGWDIEVDGPEAAARANFHGESRGWSVLLSANAYSTGTLRRAFRHEGPVLEAGYPLTDPLLDASLDRSAVAARLGLPADRRFVLYAPTWRDHRPVGPWRFDFDLHLDLQAVSAALAPDQMLLIKAHHLVAAGLDAAALPDNVRDVSHLEDITELCALADVLVTDYSSVFFDFAVTGRPILFYCYDLDLYARQVRGFYLDVERDLPGPVARDSSQLLALLADLPAVSARYADRYRRFRERYCTLADGRCAQRVVDAVFGPAPAADAGRAGERGTAEARACLA
ncbi:CDP-glycerol glycerophosphotransferase family protein [Pseudoxanthomonas sp. Soil82]|uniref:CDP-glycerol glycerophosphotransferase family protein n=1 Tax=Pseudoxanthomonas sp. Soil82 TaxID=3157341 RepID=UPI00338DB233